MKTSHISWNTCLKMYWGRAHQSCRAQNVGGEGWECKTTFMDSRGDEEMPHPDWALLQNAISEKSSDSALTSQNFPFSSHKSALGESQWCPVVPYPGLVQDWPVKGVFCRCVLTCCSLTCSLLGVLRWQNEKWFSWKQDSLKLCVSNLATHTGEKAALVPGV